MTSPRPSPVFHEQQDGLPLLSHIDEAEAHRAMLFVCDQAEDVAQARDLLAMLGLIPAPPVVVTADPKPGPDQRLDDRIAALADAGVPAAAIAERLGIQVRRVASWRKRQQADEERGGRAERFETGWVGK